MKKVYFIIHAPLLLVGAFAARAEESCFECHELEEPLAGSVHEGFSCEDCHSGLNVEDFPHADPMPIVYDGCLDCHEIGEGSHLFHLQIKMATGDSLLESGTNCGDCHGGHAILPVSDPNFQFTAERQTSKCGSCHEIESIDYLHSSHARFAKSGSKVAPGCLDCHESEVLAGAGEFTEMPPKERIAKLCIQCHKENTEVASQSLLGTTFITSFESSVHGKALYSGNPDAPSCIDCHGSHALARASDESSHVNRSQIVTSCAQCHEEAADDYLHSIHAQAFGRGNRDAPVCTDCHGEHNIMAHNEKNAPTAPANLAKQVCGECHGSVKLTERYGMDANRLSTFEESFHGLAIRGGAVETVNCASCHGYHDVRAESDPEAMINPANLVNTCGQCHEGANERFAVGKVHVTLDRASREPVLYWIATLYIWGIAIIVGGMVIHNGLDFFHKLREKASSHWQHKDHFKIGAPHRLYVRMTGQERLQHGALAFSFIILVITGFMLRYPEAWWVEGLRNISSHAFEYRGIIHRIAAVTMCLAGFWHFLYLGVTLRGRQLFRELLPAKKDLSDMVGILKFNLGLSKERPKFGRFSYIEKTEYWALIWGSVIMTVTGFLLWYENLTIGMFTKLGFDISRTIHFYEAILATLAIIVWHFYFVIFNPDVYPMNLSWLTGKMSLSEMETEHPLELEKLERERRENDSMNGDSDRKNLS